MLNFVGLYTRTVSETHDISRVVSRGKVLTLVSMNMLPSFKSADSRRY